MRREDVAGQTFGRLTAVRYSHATTCGNSVWVFLCECGTVVERNLAQIKHNNSQIHSCGCHTRMDIAGKSFGRLFALRYHHTGRHRNACWEFICDCGNVCICRVDQVQSGNTQSCGCLKKEQNRLNLNQTIHGHARRGMVSKEFRAWQMATELGICEEWNDFEHFLLDVGTAPTKQHILSRKNKSGVFSPDNCEWVTAKEHTRNRKSNILLTIGGVTKTATDWEAEKGLTKGVLLQRKHRGILTDAQCVLPVGEVRKMAGERRSGPNNNRWNPLLTDEDRQARDYQRLELKKWSLSVFQRDNFCCAKCLKTGGQLNAHHKNGWNKFADQRFLVSNGATLCENCHLSFHSQFGFGDNTEEQFIVFMEAA